LDAQKSEKAEKRKQTYTDTDTQDDYRNPRCACASRVNYGYYTQSVVLIVDPAWRSFLTTLEWPLEDAIIREVVPPLSCEELLREECC